MRTLTEAADVSDRGVRAVLTDSRLYSLIFRLQRSCGPPISDALDTLKTWLGRHPSDAQTAVAAIVVGELGTNHDIDWWQALDPQGEQGEGIQQKMIHKLRRQRWGR